MSRKWLSLLSGLTLFFALMCASASVGAEGYEIIGLEPLPGHNYTNLGRINNQGTVVGSSGIDALGEPSVAVRWNPKTGKVKVLPAPEGYATFASSINERGFICGGIYKQDETGNVTDARPVIWKNGKTVSLPSLPGDTAVYTYSINNKGQVVGVGMFELLPGLPTSRAYLWDRGRVFWLPFLFPSPYPLANAFGISDSGQVAGSCVGSDSVLHACLWERFGSQLTDLHRAEWRSSNIYNFNDAGLAVGSFLSGDDFVYHAALWDTKAGTTTDLGTIGGIGTDLYAINNLGQAVGLGLTPDFVFHAILYTGGALIDLNTLIPSDSGWTLETAQDINDAGQIVGSGTFNGAPRGFLLNPK